MPHKTNHLLALLLVPLFLTSCLGLGDGTRSGDGFESIPPSELQAVTSQGITIHAYVVISLDPETHHELTLNPDTNNFQGTVTVQRGQTFDATVVYTADDPVTNQTLEIAHYVRKGLVASGDDGMDVSYEGDEANWETLFDLSPGTPNVMNLDGDSYNNFVEIVYGSDATLSESLPAGPSANVTVKDELFGSLDVGLPPPGADNLASLRGEEELTLSALTPFDVQSIEVVSPTFGFQTTSYPETRLKGEKQVLKEKSMKIRLNTERFVTGPDVGEMTLTIRVVDEYDIARETTFTFAAYNPIDDLAPYLLQWGLQDKQSVADSAKFLLELDDPSIDNSSVQLRITRSEALVDSLLLPSDEDPSAARFKSNVTLDVSSFPDGEYGVTLSAKDLAGNLYTEARTIQVNNTTVVLLGCGDGKRLGDEECDDGNRNDADSCTNACRLARCGDGVRSGVEECDDGNRENTDSCTNSCRNAVCGDGFVGSGEACDDGNQVNTDSCTARCQVARCGDGVIGPSEICDDGNGIDTDACTNSCQLAACGDGVVLASVEQCDDNNNLGNDGCNATCQIEPATIEIETPPEGAGIQDIVNVRATATSLAGVSLTFFGITD
ncbi:MAG: DUF4215 domain-containing protein, partial [Deltaproteobacteria bacterium]|nr:DUF4215 domain-containing protein [Deltaproteobacteria bacterium]